MSPSVNIYLSLSLLWYSRKTQTQDINSGCELEPRCFFFNAMEAYYTVNPLHHPSNINKTKCLSCEFHRNSGTQLCVTHRRKDVEFPYFHACAFPSDNVSTLFSLFPVQVKTEPWYTNIHIEWIINQSYDTDISRYTGSWDRELIQIYPDITDHKTERWYRYIQI